MPKIVVIEDEAPIRENLMRFLRLEGYQVLAEQNGALGLDLVRREAPDLVLCDMMMPVMSGIEVLGALKADAATAAIPFVFLTASAEKERVEQGLALGAAAYVTKPFELGDLARRLKTWLASPS